MEDPEEDDYHDEFENDPTQRPSKANKESAK
jgi:hypothetical protein